MNIELWRNVKIVDTSATATKRLIKIIAVGLVTAILLGTTIGHTKQMDNKDTNKDIELLKTRIKKHEGYKLLPYHLKYTRKRVEGGEIEAEIIKENFKTGGFGHKILEGEKAPEGGYTKEHWERVFEKDFKNAHDGALRLVGTDMDYRAIGVLTEMIYQMGYTGVSKFKNTLNYMNNGQWELASDEMLNSDWAQQTPDRAVKLSKIIKNIQ